MALSAAEKAVGRRFRDDSAAVLATLWRLHPDAAKAPPFLHEYRHDCRTRRGLTQSVTLHEVYVPSPELWVCYCGSTGPNSTIPHEDCDGGVRVPEGFFAYIYQQGECQDCGLQVLSTAGRLVLASERPPMEKARVRQASAHPGDS